MSYPKKEQSQKLNLRHIQMLIEKDLERKIPSKLKQQYKRTKEISELILETRRREKQNIIEREKRGADELNLKRGDFTTRSLSPMGKNDKGKPNGNPFNFEKESFQAMARDRSQIISPESKYSLSTASKYKIDETPSKKSWKNVFEKKKKLKQIEKTKEELIMERLRNIQRRNSRIRESVVLQLNRLNNPLQKKDLLAQQIRVYIENETEREQEEKMKEKMNKIIDNTERMMQYAKYNLLPQPNSESQHYFFIRESLEEQRLNKLIKKQRTKILATNTKDKSNRRPSFIDTRFFDYNKYDLTSPFARKKRDLTPEPSVSPLSKEIENQQQRINKILKNCNDYHNQLATLGRRQGQKLQNQYDVMCEQEDQTIRQIDVAKGLLFTQLCDKDLLQKTQASWKFDFKNDVQDNDSIYEDEKEWEQKFKKSTNKFYFNKSHIF